MRMLMEVKTASGFTVTKYDAGLLNINHEYRIDTVTSIASLAYGRESAKNPEKLYEKLKQLKHESLWEFIRCAPLSRIEDSMRNLGKLDESYPFETCPDCARSKIALFKVRVPIFIARQFMRHRAFSYLEMSRRYVKDGVDIWFPEGVDTVALNEAYTNIVSHVKGVDGRAEIYNRYLPLATFTEFFVMMEPNGAKNFLHLRLAKDAQKETREVATLIYAMLEDDFITNVRGGC